MTEPQPLADGGIYRGDVTIRDTPGCAGVVKPPAVDRSDQTVRLRSEYAARQRYGKVVCDALGLDPSDVTDLRVHLTEGGQFNIDVRVFVADPDRMDALIAATGEAFETLRFTARTNPDNPDPGVEPVTVWNEDRRPTSG